MEAGAVCHLNNKMYLQAGTGWMLPDRSGCIVRGIGLRGWARRFEEPVRPCDLERWNNNRRFGT